jgi:hypothetical protein
MTVGEDIDGAGSRDDALTRERATRLAEAYVGAYNDRDLEAMLALMDDHVVSYPARLFGQRQTNGHAGVRAWWQSMVASDRWYEVTIREVRPLMPDRIAVLGDLLDHGEPLSPWGVIVRVADGLIVESRSYLSDEELLEELGVLE